MGDFTSDQFSNWELEEKRERPRKSGTVLLRTHANFCVYARVRVVSVRLMKGVCVRECVR